MSIKAFDLRNEAEAKQLREYVASHVVEAIENTLGPGFTLHETSFGMDYRAKVNWRQVRVALSSLDKLDEAIEQIKADILKRNSKNFLRMNGRDFLTHPELQVYSSTSTGQGTSFRVTFFVTDNLARMDIDWVAWP